MVRLFISFLVSSTFLFAQMKQWSIDKAHSKIGFMVTHMAFSEVEGRFSKYEENIKMNDKNPSILQAEITIYVNSINTDNKSRDKDLKSPSFFNVKKYPTIKFKVLEVKLIEGKKYELIGNMTIKGITKKIKLDALFKGYLEDPWGNYNAGWKITGIIKHKDFGLTLDSMMDNVIGEEVHIRCDITMMMVKN